MKQLALIVSESEFLASLELERVRAHWTKKGYAAEELGTEDLQALFYALDTPSLLGDGRFIVVRGSARDLDAAADRLASWAADPPPGIAVAIVLSSATKLKKALGARAEVLEPASPKPWETADWVVRHTKGVGRVISKEAAAALVEAVGTDLRDLATAVEQLTTATKGSIGPDEVQRLFRGMETALYTFLDAILQRDVAASFRHLGALIRTGTHPLQIVNALGHQLRALALARDPARAPAAQIARELGVAVGYANRAQRAARNFDASEVRRAFRALAEADLALKGGMDGDDTPPELVMERLVAELCGERRAAARR